MTQYRSFRSSIFAKYLGVRFLTRAIEAAIYLPAFFVYKVEPFPYLLPTAVIAHYTIDFFVQKIWVFGNEFDWSMQLFKEMVKYILVRGLVAGSIIGSIYLLVDVFSFSTTFAGAIVGCTALIFCFFLWRRIFQKNKEITSK